jgi:hypothetical protein
VEQISGLGQTSRRAIAVLAFTLAPLAAGCHAAPAPPPPIAPAATAALASAPAPPPAPTAFRFAWPVPGRVAVAHRGTKDGQTLTMRYDLTTRRAAEGGPVEVRFERFEFIDLDGVDLRAAEHRPVVAQLQVAVAAIPVLLVSPEGEFVGVTAMDQMIDAVLKLTDDGKDPKKRAAVSRTMHSPEVKALLEEKTGDYWAVWVGLWKDLRLVPGQRWETMFESKAAGGAVVRTPTLFEHHGATPGAPGLVRLSMESVTEGEQARAAAAGLLAEIASQMGQSTMPRVLRVRRELHASVDTDPDTLRPKRARLETLLEMHLDGHPPARRRQIDEYELDWPSAR